MKEKLILCCSLFLLLIQTCLSQTPALPNVTKVDSQPQKGFQYPYYLYIPPKIKSEKNKAEKYTVFVIPNNTGTADDDYSVHDNAARKQCEDMRGLANKLNIIVLVPSFPRPKSDWQIYTHALDRDSLITKKNELKRFDLQLVHMLDDAAKQIGKEGIRVDKRILMLGFSAAGMFTNRFAFLHPDRIKAAAIGSPGGWAIAPVEKWKGEKLRYPIGTADFKMVSGKNFDLKKLKKVPLFLFLGDEDKNDSVIYRDAYELEDEKLIFELFGKTLLERWKISKTMYAENLPQATLKLYPKVGHSFSKEIWADIIAFFTANLNKPSAK